MAIWDGLKALFFVLLGLSILALLPFVMTFMLITLIIFIAVALIVGYVQFKKEERADSS